MPAFRLMPLAGSVQERLRHGDGRLDGLPAETLHPAESLYQHPVLMLPDEGDRIVRVQQETTLEQERLRLAGGMREHGPTRRLRLGAGLVTPRGVFTMTRALGRHGPAPLRKGLTAPLHRVRSAFAPLNAITLRYFGHLIHDGLPAALLARPGEALCLPVDPRWHHARDYVGLSGLDPIAADFVAADEVWLCDDLGMNSHRRARMCALRDRLHSGLAPSGQAGVFLRRGDTGAERRLVNEGEVAGTLAARGFAICDVASPLPELLARLSGSRIVVSIEGSHLVHGLFGAAAGATLVAINPGDRFNAFLADLVPALGQRLATIVAEPVAGGYRLDTDRLQELLDLLDRKAVASG